MQVTVASTCVHWLPQDHDFGLIGRGLHPFTSQLNLSRV